MIANRLDKYWTPIIIFLVAIITIGGIVAWLRYNPNRPIEISVLPSQEMQGGIYIAGAITNPGFSLFEGGDSVDALLRAAGGTTSNADLSRIRLYIPEVGEVEQPQRIDINRAEPWLLEALPGIGETLAQRIIDYRSQNGPFHNINELIKVKGIGTTAYGQIKHLITIAD
jgi:competence protein ComEA